MRGAESITCHAPPVNIWQWWKAHQARIFRYYHAISAMGWAVMIPVAFVTGWAKSVAFVTVLSLWALVATEWGAAQAAGAEQKAEQTGEDPKAPTPHNL